jgi:hypothetical protein
MKVPNVGGEKKKSGTSQTENNSTNYSTAIFGLTKMWPDNSKHLENVPNLRAQLHVLIIQM